MRAPLFVRSPTEEEERALAAGLHSADAFTLRRCQIILASARGERAPAITRALGCSDQTVRNAIRAFDARGVTVLAAASARPHTVHAAFLREHIDEETRELFPAIEGTLAADDAALVAAFERIEEEQVGPGTHERLHRLIDDLPGRIDPFV